MNRTFLFFLFFLLTTPAFGGIKHVENKTTRGPLEVRSQNPLYLLYIADIPENVSTLSKNKWQLGLSSTFSNLYENDFNPLTGYAVDLDMELIRNSFQAKYGITNHSEIGIELATLSSFGGFLDAFVQGYHNFFGLPNGGRDLVANNRFNYNISRFGVDVYSVNSQKIGFGDLTLTHKLRVFDETKTLPALTVKSSLKLPTGVASMGLGSGKVDGGVSFILKKSVKRFHFLSQVGFYVLGSQNSLAQISRGAFVSFAQTFEFNFSNRISFITQFTGNSPQFKSTGLSEVDQAVFDVTVGIKGDVLLKDKWIEKLIYEIGFMEDALPTGPSVDFSAYAKIATVF